MGASILASSSDFSELGVRRNFLEDLTLKIVYLSGETSLPEIADQLKLNQKLVDQLLHRLRREQLCEVTGMNGPVFRVQTTSRGKTRALELLAASRYAGAAPVSLESYTARVREQSALRSHVGPAELELAFRHLVVSPELLAKLGAALTSGRSIFLYGPTGTGKTTIAETLSTLLGQDLVWIPYAVEIEGQIVTVFDPLVHERAAEAPAPGADARWVLCHRPSILLGGELTIEMLDLQFNPANMFYTAPVHMKANNGVLIVDDFGRQRVRPTELLNRWVVPLDRQMDFLVLASGQKVKVPFDALVVFATNLDTTVIEEAFLRRIQTKVKIDYAAPEQFRKIFSNECLAFGLSDNGALADLLIDLIRKEYSQPLRPCYPRDVLNQLIWTAQYKSEQPRLSEESLTAACRMLFVTPGS